MMEGLQGGRDCLTCKNATTWIPWDAGMPQHEAKCLVRKGVRLLAIPGRIDPRYHVLCEHEPVGECSMWTPKD